MNDHTTGAGNGQVSHSVSSVVAEEINLQDAKAKAESYNSTDPLLLAGLVREAIQAGPPADLLDWTSAAIALGQRIPAGWPGRDAAVQALARACARPEEADWAAVAEAVAGVEALFLHPPAEAGEAGGHEDARGVIFRDTDLANARRLAGQHGQDIRYCHPWRSWLVWDGRRWRRDADAEIMRRAERTAAAIYHEAAEAADKEEARKLAQWARTSQTRTRLEAMVALCQHQRGIPVSPDALDADPWLLNVENGTLDLRSGELRAHRREDLITRFIPIPYDPAAACPTWQAFLHRVMGGNTALIEFLQRAVGYSLAGTAREQVFFLLYGTGRNGKSTFLDVLLRLTGDYARQTRFETFLQKDLDRVNNDLAALAGARVVVAAESGEGKRLDESLIKSVTGGDRVVARFLYSEFFEYVPRFRLWLATNHKPTIRGTDPAIWRRPLLIPFAVTIPEEEVDRDLPAKLAAELPGILAWAVQGCWWYLADGLQVPAEVRAATQAYRDEMDVLAAFLEDCCVVAANARASAGDLYRAYCAWCEDAGERPASQRIFGLRLGERGFAKEKAHVVWWRGIGLAAGGQEVKRQQEERDPTDWSWFPQQQGGR